MAELPVGNLPEFAAMQETGFGPFRPSRRVAGLVVIGVRANMVGLGGQPLTLLEQEHGQTVPLSEFLADLFMIVGLIYGENRMWLTRSENRGSVRSLFQRGSRRSQTSQCDLSSKALLSHTKAASISPSPA